MGNDRVPTIADALADFVASLRPNDIPEPVRERARHLILDAVGIAHASTHYEFAHRSLSAAQELSGGAGATPVIAFRRGSVPEIIEHGRSGFVVDDIEQAVAAVRRVREIDRAACRAAFEERFTAQRMASDYVDLYRNICVQAPSHRAAAQTRDAFPSLSA